MWALILLRAQEPANLPVQLAEGFCRYQDATLHEAGYDAFITGCVFAWLSPPTLTLSNIMILTGTFYSMNLAGPDILIETDLLFHCSFLTAKTLSNSDVVEIFQPTVPDIRVRFIDGRNCVVFVDRKYEHEVELFVAQMAANSTVAVVPWLKFRECLSGLNSDGVPADSKSPTASGAKKTNAYSGTKREQAQTGQGDQALSSLGAPGPPEKRIKQLQ